TRAALTGPGTRRSRISSGQPQARALSLGQMRQPTRGARRRPWLAPLLLCKDAAARLPPALWPPPHPLLGRFLARRGGGRKPGSLSALARYSTGGLEEGRAPTPVRSPVPRALAAPRLCPPRPNPSSRAAKAPPAARRREGWGTRPGQGARARGLRALTPRW